MMREIMVLSLLLVGFGASAGAQSWTDYLNGSFHRPTLELDEYGDLQAPLLMYQDERVEASTPDFTGTYDSVTRPAAFKRNGDYEFVLYVYHKDSYKTSRTLVSGNAQNGEIRLHMMDNLGGLFGPLLTYHHNKGLPIAVEKSVLAYLKLRVNLHEKKP